MTSLFALINDPVAQAEPTLDEDLTPEGLAITMECALAHAEVAEQQIALLLETQAIIAKSPEVSDGILETIKIQVATAESLANEYARPRFKQVVMESLTKNKASNKVMAMENLNMAVAVLIPVLLGVASVVAFRQANKTINSIDQLNADLAKQDEWVTRISETMKQAGVREQDFNSVLQDALQYMLKDEGVEDVQLDGLLSGFKGKPDADFSMSSIRTAIKEGDSLIRVMKSVSELSSGFYGLLIQAAELVKNGHDATDSLKRLDQMFDLTSNSVVELLCGGPYDLRSWDGAEELLDTGMQTFAYSAIPFAGIVGVSRRSQDDPTLVSRVLHGDSGSVQLNKDIVTGVLAASKDIQEVSRIMKTINASEEKRSTVTQKEVKRLQSILSAIGTSDSETVNRDLARIRRMMTRMASVYKFVNECTATYDNYMARSASVLRRILTARARVAKEVATDVTAKAA